MKKHFYYLVVTLISFANIVLGQAIEVKVSDGLNNALAFVNTGAANEIILVDDGGLYITNPTTIETPVKIRAKEGLQNPPVVVIKGCQALPFFKIKNDFEIEGIIFDGYDSNAGTYDSIQYVFQVQAMAGGVNEKPKVTIKDCIVRNIYKYGDPETSTDGTILDFAKGARAGDVLIENTTFMNTGDEALRAINTHKDPVPLEGKFAETFTVRNCTFHNIRGSAIKIEDDGDSTNVDTQVLIDHCTFNKSQRRVIWHRDLSNSIIRNLLITNLIQGNDQLGYIITVQREGTIVSHIDTFNVSIPNYTNGFLAETPASWSGAQRTATIDESTIYNYDPMYKDPDNADFTLDPNSPVRTLASDGKALGDLRWAGDVVSVEENGVTPTSFELKQNFPNPFNPSTVIEFTVPKAGAYTLKVYNVLGQEVATLINRNLAAGTHTTIFNAKNLPSGLYLYKLSGENINLIRKMMLMK
ncbi:5'-nucleotidase domain-containing protein [Melioribacter roseus P3M-2]|uniref:5'-nucleotidase domain-containing protein n=1 Tax=Melioribacter roseus (strain DSM 23840 / JCM 17771 / VKM B-2668 / P3M-2) TaxID=1191523 RepID=I6YVK8_MELRP|nr:DUF5123 domain-containing protein [Melioribacter roseus]AFN74597.1 5'-nucleotidase domain-containing protein [Melioribacter roseus P3M-2]